MVVAYRFCGECVCAVYTVFLQVQAETSIRRMPKVHLVSVNLNKHRERVWHTKLRWKLTHLQYGQPCLETIFQPHCSTALPVVLQS